MASLGGMTPSCDPTPRALKPAALALVALAAFSYGFVPIRATNDTWWHLKSGEVILQRGSLPENDVFTYTGENIPWHNHEWLAQVVFYKVFQWGGGRANDMIGLRALIAFKSLVIVATFLLVFTLVQQRVRCMTVAALITLLAIDVSRFTFYPRPPIFTYLFLALFLLVLHNWKSGRWPAFTLIILPPLMALWANIHGGFLVGVIVVGFFLAGEIAEYLFWQPDEKESRAGNGDEDKEETAEEAAAWRTAVRSRALWLGGVLVVCVAASLCTPYGYHLYELPFRVMGAKGLVKTIAELHSPLTPHLAFVFLSFLIMAGVLIVSLGAACLVSRKRPAAADLLMLLFFGYQAVSHQRHLPLFAITAAPLLAWAVGRLIERESEWFRRRTVWLAASAALLVAVYWLGLRASKAPIYVPGEFGPRQLPQSYLHRNRQLAGEMTYIEINFPKAVCDFIRDNQFHGRMFNPLNSAGYLIWRLSPERHKLFTDSRFDVFGDRFVWYEFPFRHGIEPEDWDRIDWEKADKTEEEGRAIRERLESAGWREILDKWNVNFVIAEKGWRVVPKMIESPEWELVYYWTKPYQPEFGYEIFVRRTRENAELIRRCQRNFKRTLERGGT